MLPKAPAPPVGCVYQQVGMATSDWARDQYHLVRPPSCPHVPNVNITIHVENQFQIIAHTNNFSSKLTVSGTTICGRDEWHYSLLCRRKFWGWCTSFWHSPSLYKATPWMASSCAEFSLRQITVFNLPKLYYYNDLKRSFLFRITLSFFLWKQIH